MTSNHAGEAPTRVLLLIVCAAPPARAIGELVDILIESGWSVCVIATPTAASWINVDALAARTGMPVRSLPRDPDVPGSVPDAQAIVVAPATFNTINKWAAGINDTLALGLLNEALGSNIPIIVSPYAKAELMTHPAFSHSLEVLRACGVHLTETEALRPVPGEEQFRWHEIVDAFREAVP
jgi:phosphopantothenoylcysteine synthetase/decarboxylase